MRAFGARRGLWYKGTASQRLPAVGPFQNLTPPAVSSLPNFTYASGTNAISTSRASPLKANTITLSSGATLTHAGTYYIWIWCNVFNWSGDVTANGSAGGDYSSCCISTAGSGGDGGSGGGGGEADSGGCFSGGGVGGSGNNGAAGPGGGCSTLPGAGGTGYGLAQIAGNPYPLIDGGYGGGVDCTGNGGASGPGYGGGGGGGGFVFVAGGGGGGGGGIIVVARQIIGAPVSRAIVSGGAGGNGAGGGYGGGGGGGSANLFATQYTPLTTFNVSGGAAPGCTGQGSDGNYRLVEINKAGTALGTIHTNSNVSWNNL